MTFSLWLGAGGNVGTNTLVRQTTMAAVDIAQSFGASETFVFPATTLANGTYSIQLTQSGGLSNKNFNVKTGAFQLTDGGAALSSELYSTDGNLDGTSTNSIAAVPEPSEFLLGGVPALLGGLALMRRRVARESNAGVA